MSLHRLTDPQWIYLGESFLTLTRLMTALAGAIALVYTVIKLNQGDGLRGIIPLFLVLMLVLVTIYIPEMLVAGEGGALEVNGDSSAASKVTEFLNNDETDKLLEYLKSVNSGSSDKLPLINYVVAQVSIKDGEADIDLVKSVVDTYKAGTLVTEIPDNIRYALEMAAFSKAVTPAAVSYEDNKNDLARNYSSSGKSSFFTGGGLTLIGVLILAWVRRLNLRVQFLSNYAIR